MPMLLRILLLWLLPSWRTRASEPRPFTGANEPRLLPEADKTCLPVSNEYDVFLVRLSW